MTGAVTGNLASMASRLYRRLLRAAGGLPTGGDAVARASMDKKMKWNLREAILAHRDASGQQRRDLLVKGGIVIRARLFSSFCVTYTLVLQGSWLSVSCVAFHLLPTYPYLWIPYSVAPHNIVLNERLAS